MKKLKLLCLSTLALCLATPSFAGTTQPSQVDPVNQELSSFFEGDNQNIAQLSDTEMQATEGEFGFTGAFISGVVYLVTTPRSEWNAQNLVVASAIGGVTPAFGTETFWTSSATYYGAGGSAVYHSYGKANNHNVVIRRTPPGLDCSGRARRRAACRRLR